MTKGERMQDDEVRRDAEAGASLTRSMHPEVILLSDHTVSCITWTLNQEIARLDDFLAEHPGVRDAMNANGWTTRALALGHILAGLRDLADFDDENGRM